MAIWLKFLSILKEPIKYCHLYTVTMVFYYLFTHHTCICDNVLLNGMIKIYFSNFNQLLFCFILFRVFNLNSTLFKYYFFNFFYLLLFLLFKTLILLCHNYQDTKTIKQLGNEKFQIDKEPLFIKLIVWAK